MPYKCKFETIQPGGGVSQSTLKNYCWMYSTFNIPEDFEGNCARSTNSDTPVYNTYYQWVPIFLIFQVQSTRLREHELRIG